MSTGAGLGTLPRNKTSLTTEFALGHVWTSRWLFVFNSNLLHMNHTLRRWRSQTKFNVNLCVDPRVGQSSGCSRFSCARVGVSSVDGGFGNDRSTILSV